MSGKYYCVNPIVFLDLHIFLFYKKYAVDNSLAENTDDEELYRSYLSLDVEKRMLLLNKQKQLNQL